MSKINLTYENIEYTLEYNRQSVRTLEGQGFVLDELTTKPATMIPMLFSGAFFKNHRGIKRSKIDEIYDNIGDKSGLIQALGELYAESLSSLFEDKPEQGNAQWAMVK